MTMDKREQRSSSKKARVEESALVQVKEEAMEEGGETGAGAMVAMEADPPREELTVKIYKDKLHCPFCTLPLKPPIFQCESGHSVCGMCHALLPKDKCYACGRDGAYHRNAALEDFVGWHRIPCPYGEYGCRADVTYHEAGAHQLACPFAPCRCSEPGCAFAGAPPALRDHLAAAPHSWPVDKIRYGVNTKFSLPASLPWRLLVAEEEDGRVFLVSASARAADPSYRRVSVVCVRASGAAAAGPPYTCSMWVTGHKSAVSGRSEIVMVQGMDVPSCSELGEAAAAKEAVRLMVPNDYLHGEAMEMRLCIKIDKVQA